MNADLPISEMTTEREEDNNGNFTINTMFEGSYEVIAGQWGYITSCDNEYIDGTSNVIITLDEGYYDDFTFDFGWAISGGITSSDPGRWERGDPEGTSFQGSNFNPDNDINTDCFDYAYVTGVDAGSQVGSNDVDDFNTILTSPIFDLSQASPNGSYYLSYHSWFANGGGGWGGGSPADDSLTVSITNGSVTSLLEVMTSSSPEMGQWNFRNFELSQYITLTNNMQIIIETADWDALGGHWVEAGFDLFQITSSLPTDVDYPVILEDRNLLRIVDILGREVTPIRNTHLFYIYDDGSVEKRVIVK